MTKIILNGHAYEIPARWSEVTDRAQFLALCQAIFRFETRITGFDEFRTELAIAALGLNLRKVKPGDNLYENIFRVGELITFPYTLRDREDGSRELSITIRLHNNIVGAVNGVKGYSYRTDAAGVVDTDLTAGQYIEGIALLNHYSAITRSERNEDAALEVLASLVHTLYPLPAPHYARNLTTFTREEKLGILYNFRGITEAIAADPDYDLIFNHTDHSAAPSPVGLQSSVFALSKAGLGDVEQVRRLDVHTYLSALVQQTIDSIQTLAGAGLKPGKIAEKLHLTVDQVAPFTTNFDA